MIISSLLVEAAFGQVDEVEESLKQVSKVEVHGVKENQVIVTIEADTVEESHAIASDFITIEGVNNVNLIYANFEDDPYIKKAVEKQ